MASAFILILFFTIYTLHHCPAVEIHANLGQNLASKLYPAPPGEGAGDDRYLITFRGDLSDDELDDLLSQFGRPGGSLPSVDILHCPGGPRSKNGKDCPGRTRINKEKGPKPKSNSRGDIVAVKVRDTKDLEALLADDRVLSIHEDALVKLYSVCNTENALEWNLDHLDTSESSASVYRDSILEYDPNGGSGILAYILDTGITTSHPLFSGRAVWGATFCNGRGCEDQDGNGHGTHVAGVVGADTYGVARAVQLIAVKVVSDFNIGTNSDAISGVNWAVSDAASKNKRAVINMSLGGGGHNALDDAVNAAVSAGVMVVAAAGNEYGEDSCDLSPSGASEAFTVASHDYDSSNSRSVFSNIGTCVDIFAPGNVITSLSRDGSSTLENLFGTSIATPHVTGAAVTYLSLNSAATVDEVKAHLIGTAVSGAIADAGTGSPNLMLQVPCVADPTTVTSSTTTTSTPSNTPTTTATPSYPPTTTSTPSNPPNGGKKAKAAKAWF